MTAIWPSTSGSHQRRGRPLPDIEPHIHALISPFRYAAVDRCLEAGNRGGRIERLRAKLLAGLVRMAGMAAAVGGDGLEARWRLPASRCVIDQRPCPRQRCRSEIGGVPAHRVAAGIADAAIDAFDRRVGGHARRRVGPDLRDRVMPRLRRCKHALGALPLLKELLHVGGQILDHRQDFPAGRFQAGRCRRPSPHGCGRSSAACR